MQLHCPQCGLVISADQLDLQAAQGRCVACDLTIPFAGMSTATLVERLNSSPFARRTRVHITNSELMIVIPAARSLANLLASVAFIGFFLFVAEYWMRHSFDAARNPLEWNLVLLCVWGLMLALSFGPLLLAVFRYSGTIRLLLTAELMVIETSCFGFNSIWRTDIRRIEQVTSHDHRSDHKVAPRYGFSAIFHPFTTVDLVLDHGLFEIPVYSMNEADGIVKVIRDFLQSHSLGDGTTNLTAPVQPEDLKRA